MTQVLDRPEVLTLSEAAEYLRLPEETVRELIVRDGLPGRQIGDEWRFLKAALDDWLRRPGGKHALLLQAGAFADDETLPELLKEIYRQRGRPEVGES